MASSIVDAAPRFRSSRAESQNGIQTLQRVAWHGSDISSWASFHASLHTDQPLLARLDDFYDGLLVAGCHRPAVTAITRLFKRAHGTADYSLGHDDELDGALLLAGYVNRFALGRHCFQTTYLHESFAEYFEHDDFRLVWVLREPLAVICSMLNDWTRSALDGLLPGRTAVLQPPRPLGSETIGASRVDKACALYLESIAELFTLRAALGGRMTLVDYDALATHRDTLLPDLFDIVELRFDEQLLSHLHGKSIRKGNTLAEWEELRVRELCSPAYRSARALCAIGAAHG